MEALPLKTEDEDVARERERVETGRTSEDQLRLVGLSKVSHCPFCLHTVCVVSGNHSVY